MRRLAFLLLPLGVACSAPNPLSGYPGEYAPQQGQGGQSGTTSADDGGAVSSSQPTQGSGSAPSPLTHNDAGSWREPDAQAPVYVPPGDDAGSPSYPSNDDAGNAVAPDSAAPTSDDAGSNGPLVATCVSEINSFRAQNGLSPYATSPDLEAFAAQAAASDAQSGQLDGYFDGNGGSNVSSAEDELPGAQVEPGGTAAQVLNQGLLDEEEGYLDGAGNLLSQQYGSAGCGVAQASDGSYWIAIEYR